MLNDRKPSIMSVPDAVLLFAMGWANATRRKTPFGGRSPGSFVPCDPGLEAAPVSSGSS